MTAIPAGMSYLGAREANRVNREIAREQMAFQERMSSTSWQRAVADMKLAGINPMLAFQQGGASSPSGATTRVEDAVGPAVSSAMHGMRLRQELRMMQAQRENVEMDTAKKEEEAKGQALWNQINAYGRRDATGATEAVPYRALEAAQRYENLIKEGKYREAQTQLSVVQRALIEAGLPAAEVMGSTPGAILRLLFGGAGAVGRLMPSRAISKTFNLWRAPSAPIQTVPFSTIRRIP